MKAVAVTEHNPHLPNPKDEFKGFGNCRANRTLVVHGRRKISQNCMKRTTSL